MLQHGTLRAGITAARRVCIGARAQDCFCSSGRRVQARPTAQYVLVLDALNFCFWPSTTDMQYDTLAVGLKRALERDPDAFNAERLAVVTPEILESWFQPVDVEADGAALRKVDVPNLEERARILREVGDVLRARWDGAALSLVARANRSARELVRLVVAEFPAFRDEVVVDGTHMCLYKRAQIFVADVWAALGRGTGTGPAAFTDMHALTCFADYRIPQLLRELGVLEYGPDLSSRVDTHTELPAYGKDEVAIRAATVVAVDKLAAAVNTALERDAAAPDRVCAVELDWLLWQRGEAHRYALRPHHETRTIFY